VPYTVLIISRVSFKQFSLIFLCDIVSLKPTIVLIIGHFLTCVKFREILRQYQNSVEMGKFRGSAQNSAARRKLWALAMMLHGWKGNSRSLLALAMHYKTHP